MPNIISNSGVYDTLAFTIHRYGGKPCISRIMDAFNELNDLVNANESEVIQNQLHLCKPVKTDDMSDVAALFVSYLRYIIDYIETNHFLGVQNICQALNIPSLEPLASLTRWVQYVYREDHATCNDLSYETLVLGAQNETWQGPRSVGTV